MLEAVIIEMRKNISVNNSFSFISCEILHIIQKYDKRLPKKFNPFVPMTSITKGLCFVSGRPKVHITKKPNYKIF